MLHRIPSDVLQLRTGATETRSNYYSLGDVLRFLKRHRWPMILSIAAGILLALAYLARTTPLYTASAQIIIDPKISAVPLRETASDAGATLDSALVESQTVVMRSENIAKAVIDSLDLREDPAFQPSKPGVVGRLKIALGLVPAPAEPTDFERTRAAVAALAGALTIKRMGTSYVIEIAATHPMAQRAAPVANAVAEAYVRDQLDSKSQAVRRGSEWLEERIQRLRAQMNTASRRVQEFKVSHDYRIVPRRADAAPDAALEDQNTLEELETTAQTYRRIYDSFLQALTESIQRENFPIVGARVITVATEPLERSFPRPELILLLGAMVGTLGGLGIASLRQIGDTSVRTAQDVLRQTGKACIGELPVIGAAPGEPAHIRQARRANGRDMFEEIAIAPFSRFSDELRRMKTVMRPGEKRQGLTTIGVVSAQPQEGKSTVSANLAALFASTGARTLIVDADLRRSTLTRHFAPGATTGLVELLLADGSPEAALRPTKRENLSILPALGGALPAHTSELLGSARMHEILEALRAHFDVVIVDLPPISATADSLAIGPMLDGVILVASWAKTMADQLGESAYALQASETELLGVALNKVAEGRRPSYGYGYGWEGRKAERV